MRTPFLFAEASIFDVLQHQQMQLKRASVITSKPANGDQVKTGQREKPGRDCFTPPIPLAASSFLCANCGDRI